MKLKLLLAALLATLSGSASAEGFCSHPNANRLVWDKQFETGVQQFLGKRREMFFYNGLLRDQVLEGLGGPPDDIIDLGDNLRFASACRAHSCDEKAAVIFACPNKLLAVGIMHFDIRPNHFDARSATLTIYSDKLSPTMRSAFDAWRQKVAQANDITIATEYRSPAR